VRAEGGGRHGDTALVFESIQGTLIHRDPTRCVLEAGGIGYEIHTSLTTYEALPSTGSAARLVVHLVVREDEWRMFGFADPQERTVFRDLLRVSGVGPQVALSLLSGFRPAELAHTVTSADVKALTRVKGVGKKTAERILVELKDRWKDHLTEAPAATPEPTAEPEGPAADAVRALIALGIDGGEAAKRVAKLTAKEPELEVAELVRRGLRG